jgi:Mycobacterium membrane protein
MSAAKVRLGAGVTIRRDVKVIWYHHQVAVIAAIAAASLSFAAPGRAASSSVTYSVESDSSLATVAYFNEFNIQRQLSNVSSPWSTSFDTDPASQVLIVAATTTGQHVSCTRAIVKSCG